MDSMPTAAVADACVRLQVDAQAVEGLRPVLSGRVVVGPALPVRHAGSVDVFFEALQTAAPGSVLCIDNSGRQDEGCLGDLTALEALHHGVAGVVIDGCHRDTAALRELGLPVWSRGAFPFGPRAARPRATDALSLAMLSGRRVTADDVVLADDDGVLIVPKDRVAKVWDLARRIQVTELEQARLAKSGTPLCDQFAVADYLKRRSTDPSHGFRTHLRRLGKAIEE
jgi:4-hydroxy-4-methyl-2-oxoglutarate aldolase